MSIEIHTRASCWQRGLEVLMLGNKKNLHSTQQVAGSCNKRGTSIKTQTARIAHYIWVGDEPKKPAKTSQAQIFGSFQGQTFLAVLILSGSFGAKINICIAYMHNVRKIVRVPLFCREAPVTVSCVETVSEIFRVQ